MLKMRKGFTLIELLIVVVIIGILAAIAIPKFANTKQKAYITAMKSDLRNLVTAEEAYFADSSQYTGTVANLKFQSTNSVSAPDRSRRARATGTRRSRTRRSRARSSAASASTRRTRWSRARPKASRSASKGLRYKRSRMSVGRQPGGAKAPPGCFFMAVNAASREARWCAGLGGRHVSRAMRKLLFARLAVAACGDSPLAPVQTVDGSWSGLANGYSLSLVMTQSDSIVIGSRPIANTAGANQGTSRARSSTRSSI